MLRLHYLELFIKLHKTIFGRVTTVIGQYITVTVQHVSALITSPQHDTLKNNTSKEHIIIKPH